MPKPTRVAGFLNFVKTLAVAVLMAAAAGFILYQFFGLRVVMDGSGRPHLRFTRSADRQAALIERDRAAKAALPATSPDISATPAPTPTTSVAREAAPSPAAAPASAAEPWPFYRGRLLDGVYRDTPIQTSWPAAGLRPLWKEPVGAGYASIVVAGGRAFTIEQRGAQEVLAAYDPMTGRELWKNAWPAEFREMMGGDGPRAAPTWFDGRVYALGALGEFRCLDAATGAVIWRTNILQDSGADNLQWGMSAAPLIVDDTVVVLPGGRGGKSVMAYDRRSGARVWSALDDRAAYASPMLATIGGVRQILAISASRLMGLTPDRGQVLWEYPWTTEFDVNAAQPIVIGDNRVFVSSGYGSGAAVVELTRAGERFTVREVWRNNRMKNKFSSSVLHDGFIYGLDENILACIDAATGDLKWKGGRYGYGQILLAAGHVIVLSEEGDFALVRATPEKHDEVARFSAIEGKTWNVPAIANGILYVRNVQEMAAFDLRK